MENNSFDKKCSSGSLLWPDYLVLVLLLIFYACIGIGYGYKNFLKQLFRQGVNYKTKISNNQTTDEIFLGNRQLSLLPTLSTIVVSFLSAVALLGNNSEVFRNGIEFGCIIFGYAIAFPLTAEIYMPVFYKLQICSSNEYIEMRFGKHLRNAVTVVFMFQMFMYTSVVLFAPSLALSQVTNWNVGIAICVIGSVATFYTTIGGMKAVVWTDVVQMFIILIGFIMLIAFGIVEVGGFSELITMANNKSRLDLFDFDPNPFLPHTFFTLAFGGAGMVLSIYATNQTQIQRYLACKDLKTAKIAIHLNLPINAVFLVIQIIGGLISYAYFFPSDPLKEGEIGSYDQILPLTIMCIFKNLPVVRGIIVSSIFAAALSTLSSCINSIACVVIEDGFMQFMQRKLNSRGGIQQKTLTCIAKCSSIFIGLLVISMAFILSIVSPGVLRSAFSIFGAIGGPIFTVFTIGILMPFVNKWGGIVGFFCSLLTGVTMCIGSALTSVQRSSLNATNGGVVSSFNFFDLSYLHYTLLCFIVGIATASIVSFATGMNTENPVSTSLLAWQAVYVFTYLPVWFPSQTTNSVMISAHQKKLEKILRPALNKQEVDDDASF